MSENNNLNTDGNKNESCRMPYMCPMMYYGTYPVPMQGMWPQMDGFMHRGMNMPMNQGMNQAQMGGYYNPMYQTSPMGMGYFGTNFNVPFPESDE